MPNDNGIDKYFAPVLCCCYIFGTILGRLDYPLTGCLAGIGIGIALEWYVERRWGRGA